MSGFNCRRLDYEIERPIGKIPDERLLVVAFLGQKLNTQRIIEINSWEPFPPIWIFGFKEISITPTALESLLVAFMYTIKSMSRASHPVRWPCILHYLKLITFYDGWYLDDKGRIPPVSHDWMPGWDCPQ
jgi:hypothetical protein